MSLGVWDKKPIRVAILTVSDTRNESTDKGGLLLKEYVLNSGYLISDYKINKDDVLSLRDIFMEWLESDHVDVIISTGGTGIAKRDVTMEAVEVLFHKVIPGFGELFRYLSFAEDIGTKAMASRAIAGTYKDKLLYVLPGSTGAIKLAMEKLILPEMSHLLYELRK